MLRLIQSCVVNVLKNTKYETKLEKIKVADNLRHVAI
jgi:hypothetical protein